MSTVGYRSDEECSVIGEKVEIGFLDFEEERSVCSYVPDDGAPVVVSVPFAFVNGKPHFCTINYRSTLGQALSALLANQGVGLGLGNLLGGLGGAPVNQAGPPPAAYGNQAAMGYGNQPGLQPQYQNPQLGQSGGGRPHHGPGGAPYRGH